MESSNLPAVRGESRIKCAFDAIKKSILKPFTRNIAPYESTMPFDAPYEYLPPQQNIFVFIIPGPPGPMGPQGERGEKGETGPPGVSLLRDSAVFYARKNFNALPNGSVLWASANISGGSISWQSEEPARIYLTPQKRYLVSFGADIYGDDGSMALALQIPRGHKRINAHIANAVPTGQEGCYKVSSAGALIDVPNTDAPFGVSLAYLGSAPAKIRECYLNIAEA